MLKVLDIFSGIGGFSLGLEATGGFETIAFCEIEKYPRLVLNKHWPEVPVFEDVKELYYDCIDEKVDVIAGGFPCQDISAAGKQAGIHGKRSGLWSEFARLIGEFRPAYAIIENVPNLRNKGLEVVLRDLWSLGYDAEWHCIPASAIGAPHQRDRIWVVANSDSRQRNRQNEKICPRRNAPFYGGKNVAHPDQERTQISSSWELTAKQMVERFAQWETEPNVGRVAYGIPSRVDRLKGLGNAIVPQIAHLIGCKILEKEGIKHV